MLGYLATYDFSDNELKYEIGKTYTVNTNNIEKYGFRFTKSLYDLIKNGFDKPYNFSSYSKYLEFEILGDVQEINNNLFATNKLKIIREITDDEYILPYSKYDERGNLIYGKSPSGFEIWKEYDENNNLIHFKSSQFIEYWQEFDDRNNLIHYKDNDQSEYWKEYDENNNLIHYKLNNGSEYWYDYDKNNNVIHTRNSQGNHEWKEYDDNNNLICIKLQYADGLYKMYDKNHNLIYRKEPNGDEYKIIIED